MEIFWMASRGMAPLTIAACLIVLSITFDVAAAEDHIVGGDLGWMVPPKNMSLHFFSNWSHSTSFKILDKLVFQWNGTHTVTEVTRADYECCSSNNPLDTISEVSPTDIRLNNNGTRYFICTIGSHCKEGQKVAIHVGQAASFLGSAATGLFVGALAFSVLAALLSF